MDDAKQDLLPKLINAVELMMAATTPQAQRYEAYQVFMTNLELSLNMHGWSF